MKNPFNPSFGKQPELFLGRADIKRSIIDSLDNQNSPSLKVSGKLKRTDSTRSGQWNGMFANSTN